MYVIGDVVVFEQTDFKLLWSFKYQLEHTACYPNSGLFQRHFLGK
ncbi:MAG: hypothetical protein ACFFC7_23900 [Candidatus Hermodarchaeota archaeon]